jgi:hypothetical protein
MIRTALLAAVTLGFAAPALADNTMMLRAGEWMLTRDAQADDAQKICFGEDHPIGDLAGGGLNNCVQTTTTTRGRTVVVEALCLMPNARVTVHGTVTAIGADSYRTNSRIHFDRTDRIGPFDMWLGITARWLGPCRPDDTPG